MSENMEAMVNVLSQRHPVRAIMVYSEDHAAVFSEFSRTVGYSILRELQLAEGVMITYAGLKKIPQPYTENLAFMHGSAEIGREVGWAEFRTNEHERLEETCEPIHL